MNVLVTGAFGNVGRATIEELSERGHRVRCFDLPSRANRIWARRLPSPGGVVWGDLRDQAALLAAVEGQDVVIHLAFIIPKMSVTGVESERRPHLSRAVNVGGTRNLVGAIRSCQPRAKLVFTSSFHVYGRTQDCPPVRSVSDAVQATEHYSQHKIECEDIIKESGLTWTIFRLAAALPVAIQLDAGMFDVPLDNRMEFVHTRDVAAALACGVSHSGIWHRVLNVGGGPTCHYVYREIASRILERVGVGMLPDSAFGMVPFPTDWLDTAESQRLLKYQQRDLSHYLDDMSVALGYRRWLIRAFRPFVRAWLLGKSPHARRGAGNAEAPRHSQLSAPEQA